MVRSLFLNANTMVNLNEYLGGIATSLAEARLMSDLKSLEIAEKFAKHDLLKHFSIPRFKAQQIELSIPVAIGSLEAQLDTQYEPIDNVAFNSQTYTLLKNQSKVTAFDRKISTAIRSLIAEESELLEKNIKAQNDVPSALKQYAYRVAERFSAVYRKNVNVKLLTAQLYEALTPAIQTKATTKQQPKVIVEAHKLQEINPENIVRIKMTLNEEGMEWFTSENDKGEQESKLLPE